MKLVTPTEPGTEIKVTPEMLEPIIPIEMMYQGAFLFPKKKELLSAFLLVIHAITISIEK